MKLEGTHWYETLNKQLQLLNICLLQTYKDEEEDIDDDVVEIVIAEGSSSRPAADKKEGVPPQQHQPRKKAKYTKTSSASGLISLSGGDFMAFQEFDGL